jgi:hypothetical protein
MPEWKEFMHGFLFDRRPSIYALKIESLSSRARQIHETYLFEYFMGYKVLKSAWYTIIYENWIRSLSFDDKKLNILDPYRYIYPWLEYQIYDLMANTSEVGLVLDTWKTQTAESDVERQLKQSTTILEDQLFHINECFRTFRKIGAPSTGEASGELESLLTYYEDMVKDAQDILHIATRRMQ